MDSRSAGASAPSVGSEARGTARDVLDVFIAGSSAKARPHETEHAFVLRDLALALVDLASRSRAKAIVRMYDEPWEICVERFGGTACLSVYRSAPQPHIAAYDRAAAFGDLVAATRDVIEGLLADGRLTASGRLELASAREHLSAIGSTCVDPVPLEVPQAIPVAIEPDRDAPISFGAEFALREGEATSHVPGSDPAEHPPGAGRSPLEAVERTDLHALLFVGRMRAEIRGRSVDLGDCRPALVAEHLVDVARRAFDAWERGLPIHARVDAAGVLVGARVSSDGELALTLAPAHGDRRAAHTFPALGVIDFVEAVLTFGRSLVRTILRRDRSQSANLRLSSFRRVLRESAEALRHASQTDAKVNPTPDPYRAFATATAVHEAPPLASSGAPASRLRFTPRWRAIVPGIDLRATYLCGDTVIAGAASEMWALDRVDGRVLWRADIARGLSVVAPSGIVRLAPDGSLAVHGFATGERVLRTRIEPRTGGSTAGAVVHLPQMPRLVIVTEGEHHLVAIDLASGETRWRWSWGMSHRAARGAVRMKRVGRLLYFTCGDGALTALDVMTGAVVWRVRDRLRFRTSPAVGRDGLFVVAGGAHGIARLYRIDPYSGVVRWTTLIGGPTAPCTVEGAVLVADAAVGVATRTTHARRKDIGASGLTLAMFRIEDGAPLTHRESGDPGWTAQAPVGTSWLAVDDTFIGNMPTGEIVGVDARSGETRWRRVLGPRPLEADVPRRLEPVLRSGALFVPCSLLSPGQGAASAIDSARTPAGRIRSAAGSSEAAAGVCILRPSDGALLGAVAPTGAIPDLLRVDEHCNVYVAEESGHIAAFGALPRLSLC
ncbi:MAG TPA: PQQ-binding-like beta-propeller repeat protein [Polyangiaceae bacterium]|nr:PQQ-binding-like beta-propeller repeat protein [Polyangiaceae bacterium]